MTGPGLVEVLAPGGWPMLAMVSARVGGLMLIAPLWSMPLIPGRIRSGIALLLTLVLLPLVPPTTLPDTVGGLVGPFVIELLLGLAIGLTAAVFMAGIAVAAEVSSLQMGLSMGAAISPLTEFATPGVGELKGYLAMAIYVTLGGHLALLAGLAHSLITLPPGSAVAVEPGIRGLLGLAGSVFTTAVRAAGPIMVAMLITNVALAVLNKAMPQLNTMMVAIPVTAAVGLVVLGASLPVTGAWIAGWTSGLEGLSGRSLDAFLPLPAGR